MKYINLFFMMLLSFISMYILMYLMVNTFSNIYPSLNQFYMAGVMAIPMLIIELFLMRSMYSNKRLNALIVVISLTIFILFIIFIRKQIGITDREFLKSMVPHHAAAILMCQKASLQDPEIEELCQSIVTTQQSEINFMKTKLEDMKK